MSSTSGGSVIVAGARTPVGRLLGGLKSLSAADLGGVAIKGALEKLGDKAVKPLVVRLDGNAVAEGRKILEEFNHPLVTMVSTMDEAASKAAELASKEA